jgi:hypothetical protein
MRSHLITQMWRGTNPWGARRGKGRPRRVVSIVAVLALGPAAVLAAVLGAAPPASATTVPAPPSGWTTAFSDSFSGGAGSGVDSNWTYDIGTQYSGTGCTGNWGTSEIESETSSTANVSEDGSGHLNITALDYGGAWTSGPCGRRDGGHRVHQAAEPSQRTWLLAGLLDAWLGVPHQRCRHVRDDGLR